MEFLYTVLIALANNIDAIGARIAFSVKGIRITNIINLWVSCIAFIVSVGSAYMGEFLHGQIDWEICKYISLVIFVGMGLWFILEPVLKKWRMGTRKIKVVHIMENPEEADTNHSKDIDFKEATLLGIALSINNIGGSFSAGMIGLNSLLVGFLSAVISFVALWAGNYLSVFIGRIKFNTRAAFVSGIILILVGIKQIL